MEKRSQDVKGRIYSPDQYGSNFEPQAQSVAYEPVRSYDPSEQIKQQSAAQLAQVEVLARAANRQMEIDNRLLAANKEIASYNASLSQTQSATTSKALLGLLGFSQTAVQSFQQINELKDRAQKENAFIESAWNVTPQEQQNVGLQQAAITADAQGTTAVANELRKSGDVESRSLAMQLQDSSIFKQLEGMRFSAAEAVSNYRPFLLEALNKLPSNLKARNLTEATRLISELKRQYFGMTGLFNADRNTQLMYAQTLRAADDEIRYTVVNQAIKTQQQDNRLGTESYIYNLYGTKNFNNQQLWEKASSETRLKDHGFNSAREENAWTLTRLLGRMALEPDGLERVKQFEMVLAVPGQEGTQLGKTYAPEFQAAKQLAQSEGEKLKRQQLITLNQNLYKELNGVQDPAQRQEIIAKHQDIFAKAGFYEESYKISQTAYDLGQPQNSQYTKAQVFKAIQEREISSTEELERYRSMMKPEDYSTAEGMLKSAETQRSSEVQDTLSAGSTSFNVKLEQVAGWKKDPTGSFIPGVNTPYLPLDQVKRIQAQYKSDLEAQLILFRKQNPDLKGPALTNALSQVERDFFKSNVSDAAGKYYVPTVTGNLSDPTNKTPLNRLKALPQKLSYSPDIDKWTGSRDWTRFTSGSQAVGPTIRSQFRLNRGDKVFDQDQVAILSEAWDRGDVQKVLSRRAQELNVTPLALLNSQLRAYGQEPKMLQAPVSMGGSPPANGDFTNPLQVANYLKSRHGTPTKAAAYMSGSLQQENGAFNGQKAPWDDLGAKAGGLASWRAGRLDAIQKHFGRPITRISDAEQLDYMIMDMRKNYPQAWRTFMNPNSTPRQLEQAVYGYWVYGDVGSRFTYADRILKQLENQGTYSGLSQPAVKRTVNVGRNLLSMGVSGIWQHPNFDLNRGYVASGGQRVAPAGVSGRTAGSYHHSNQALDIALSHNTPQQLSKAWNYLVSNQAQLGIAELYWNKKGFYRDGRFIGRPGSNAIPDHDDHIHVSFK
jgi:hypothetical protein